MNYWKQNINKRMRFWVGDVKSMDIFVTWEMIYRIILDGYEYVAATRVCDLLILKLNDCEIPDEYSQHLFLFHLNKTSFLWKGCWNQINQFWEPLSGCNGRRRKWKKSHPT